MSTFDMELTFNGLVTVRLGGAEGLNRYDAVTAVTVDTSEPNWRALPGFHGHESLLSFLARDFVAGTVGPTRASVGAGGEEIISIPLQGSEVTFEGAPTTDGFVADWSANDGSMNHTVDITRFGFQQVDTDQSISSSISGLPGGTLRSGPRILDIESPHPPLTFQFHGVPAPVPLPETLHLQEVSNSVILDSTLHWNRSEGAPGLRIVIGNAYDFVLRPEVVGGLLRLSITNLPSMIHLPVQSNDTTHIRWLARFDPTDPETFRSNILLPHPVAPGASVQGKICPTTREHT